MDMEKVAVTREWRSRGDLRYCVREVRSDNSPNSQISVFLFPQTRVHFQPKITTTTRNIRESATRKILFILG
jgi:hypothetical protein